MEPRPYQREAIEAIKDALRRKQSALLVAPCGAGKTLCFCEIVDWLHSSGRRCLILLDRETLVVQTAKRIAEYIGSRFVGIACSSVSSRKDLRKPVVVASRQTLAPMVKNGSAGYKCNIVILDEVHLVGHSGQYRDILSQLKENHPALRILGCTATPYRLSGGKIYGKKDSLFDAIDHRITTEELLEAGYLVPLTWKIRKSDLNAQLDLVKKASTGDLDEAEQFRVLGKDTYVRGVYEAWVEYCKDLKTAVFALNIAHAELIRAVFESEGVKTWVIHSKMHHKEVSRCLNEFVTSTVGVMVNVGKLTTGSDIPSIGAIILAKRSLSTALIFQIVGRGSRPCPGKSACLIIDLCGNCLIHGIDPDNPVRNEKEERTWDSEPKIKVCPMCETAHSLSARTCKECGFEFPYEAKEPEEVRDSGDRPELVDFDGFRKVECDHVRYYLHPGKNGKPPTIRAEYRRLGVVVGKQWLCPQHIGFPKQKAGRYWRELGGKWPVPKTVVEWIQRNNELEHRLVLTVNYTGKYPEIKKVKILRGEEYAQSITKDRQHRAAV